ncbi:MAG: GGDEF domain-containing protein [Oscillospiraceae bacterium]|nr:GGDEF domain-containing protein [Oscillospiraceae bacterium]
MKRSLGKKIIMLVITVAVLLIVTCLCVSALVVRRMMYNEYIITADSMAGTVAAITDGDRLERITKKVMELYRSADNKMNNKQHDEPGFDAYAGQFLFLTDDPDYIAARDELRSIQDVSEVDCVYTLFVVPEEKTCVYIVDAAYEDIVTPGRFDLVEESCYPYLNDLSQGFPAFISDTREYGWVVTSCAPVYNSSGEIVCFATVDLSMNDILTKINEFLLILGGILLILTGVICVIAILYVKRSIVKPINMLSEAAVQYGHKEYNNNHNEFGALQISTGDEIEILLNSMVQMEKDIDSYIDNLTKTREQLSSARQQADDMHELAHMDAMTGIRNKMAYDKEKKTLDSEIAKGLTDCGMAMIDLNFLKVINDTYGHECGDTAIKCLCGLTCLIFDHSPVFRIGGDEFAVILRGSDYKNIEKLTAEFNKQMDKMASDDSLQPWERISASLGYALFDKSTDSSADDIFNRADRNMYERKKEMKAMRK